MIFKFPVFTNTQYLYSVMFSMRKVSIKVLILLIGFCLSFSGCGIFKKKCDCPPVGNSQKKISDQKA